MIRFDLMKTRKKSPKAKPEPREDPEVFMLPTPDPCALPLVPPKSNPLPSGGGFVRYPEIGAGQEAHQERMESLMRRAGIW